MLKPENMKEPATSSPSSLGLPEHLNEFKENVETSLIFYKTVSYIDRSVREACYIITTKRFLNTDREELNKKSYTNFFITLYKSRRF